MSKKNDVIEKGKWNVGDVHPNGKWVWTEYSPGKFDWRGIKKNNVQSQTTSATKTVPSKPTADQINTLKVKTGKPMDSQQLSAWAKKTSDDNN